MTEASQNTAATTHPAPDGPHLAREQLPIPDAKHVGLTTYDAKDPNTKYPPITMLRPPRGAPNVLIVLIDDVGFGAASAFGGPCQTPVAERLAAGGLKLNRFHTTALCSPTRQAMLTGRNHHSVGMGAITEMATSAPGNNSIRPKEKAPIAETLKLNGYSTAQFGKCHEVPYWEVSPVGPFQQWPTGSGFEYFYGFVGGEASQYYPGLYEGTTAVEPPKTPEEGYTLTEDLANHAITWVRQQKALMPDKPFFMYFAPGATHAPHQVPREWSDRYRGKFDEGWDTLREKTFQQQKKLGVIPENAELTKRHDEIPAWADMPDELKPVLARQMEIYAGFLEQTDHEVGRLVDAIDDLGFTDNTLIYYIIGDNGASAEGTLNGCFNELTTLNGMPGIETTEFLLSKIDDFGTPAAYNHYAVGWAHALCALPVDQAGGLALGRHPQRNHRALARRLRRPRRGPQPVPPRHRRGADDPRGGRVACADPGQRHRPGAAGGRQHAGHVARRRGVGDPPGPVLRDDGQPRYLFPGLDGGDQTPHAVEGRYPAAVRRRCLGAVRSGRLDPGPRSGRREPCETC
jgi:arylsulfatase A-like enzyme